MFDLEQNISCQTNIGGHCNKNSLLAGCAFGELGSDHNCITMKLGLKKGKKLECYQKKL